MNVFKLGFNYTYECLKTSNNMHLRFFRGIFFLRWGKDIILKGECGPYIFGPKNGQMTDHTFKLKILFIFHI